MGRWRVKPDGAAWMIGKFEDVATMMKGGLPEFTLGARTEMTPAQRQACRAVMQEIIGLYGAYVQVLTDADADPGTEESSAWR